MAKVAYKMPEDFLAKISRLADQTDSIVPRVLEAGGQVVLNQVRSNLSGVIGKTKYPSKSTGELLGSLGLSSVKQDRDGNHNIKVGFAEPRSDGNTNAKVATVLEYGKHNQPPRPFLGPAKASARKPCMAAMAAKLDEELGGI